MDGRSPGVCIDLGFTNDVTKRRETMNSYKWTCKGCETPNVFVHDPEEPGQISLSCNKCGTPGILVKEDERVVVRQVGYVDTCSTDFFPNTALLSSSEV